MPDINNNPNSNPNSGDTLDRAVTNIHKEEEEIATQQLAAITGLPYVNLLNYPVAPEVLRIFPKELVEKHQLFPYLRVGDQVKVATPNPKNPLIPQLLTDQANKSKNNITLYVCSPNSYTQILKLYHELPEEIDIINQQRTQTSEQELQSLSVGSLVDLPARLQKVTTSQMLEILVGSAINADASDIHIEPMEESARIRFRIDGVLQDVAQVNKQAFKQIVSRIKFLANLKLDTGKVAQDGRFNFKVLNKEIDIRLSSVPSINGEAFVLRLLANQAKFLNLQDLGLRPDAINLINQEIHKPHGLILNTGPTGSGKTTTLYAILNSLNQAGVKIITLEDPIEYRLRGVDQVQVEKKRISFADGLRAVLRQDPDIIMVGEIRDGETASIALQAAMTGHMVLSTLHTNNAPAALVRLVDMGIEPYLLSGSINLIVAQRLVRKICPTCKGAKTVNNAVCPTCDGIGYKGRVGIIETLKPTREIEQLVINRAPLGDIINMARSQGMVTLQEDGMLKVQQGITTQEEVLRVTQDYGV